MPTPLPSDDAWLDLRGPQFLVFYAVVIVISWLVLLWVRRRADPTRGQTPPPLATKLEPRELGWLRGGTAELVRLTGLDLLQRGYLQVSAARRLIAHPEAPVASSLPVASQQILSLVLAGVSSREFLLRGQNAMGAEAGVFEQRAQAQGFLMPGSARKAVVVMSLVLLFVLLTIGGLKIQVALERHRHNVVFLVILMIVAVIALVRTAILPRLSWKGRAYLQQAQVALAHLRTGARQMATDLDPMLLLAAGVFGMDVLETTSYAEYARAYQPMAPVESGSSYNSGSNCGSGSSGSGDGGGGSSSCSSGSSCSSSSGGGGGCGGCSSS